MKTIRLNNVLFISFLLFGVKFKALCQLVPEMQFTTVSLESGTAAQDGAIYRFSQVTPSLDALLEIKGRSAADVVLSSIDTSGPGMGYPKAFQPVIGINGTADANRNWSMDFRMTFVKTGTNNKTKITQFNATGLDIDGDGSTLSEWALMKGVQSIDSAIVNSLAFTKMSPGGGAGADYLVEGIIANSPGIDTTAKNVMATYTYINKDQIDFTIGAKTGALSTGAGMRLNSIWFRDFLGIILPLHWVSFDITPREHSAKLKWVTTQEQGVSYFEIEKSLDGKQFSPVIQVSAQNNKAGNGIYEFTDALADNDNKCYYRIRSVNDNGSSAYSTTQFVLFNTTAINCQLNLYPNPASDVITATVSGAAQDKEMSIEIYNYESKLVKQDHWTAGQITGKVNIGNLQRGIYIIVLTDHTHKYQQKFIKG